MTDVLCMITGIFIGAAIALLSRLNFDMPDFRRKKKAARAGDTEEDMKMTEIIRQYNNILNYTGNENAGRDE